MDRGGILRVIIGAKFGRDARGRHRPDRRGGRRVVPAVHRRGEAADAALRTCGRSGALHGGAGGGGGGARPLWGRRRARTDRGRVPRARPGGRSGRRDRARRTAAAPRRRLERRERPALALRRPRRCVRERRAPGGDLGALSAQCVHPDRGVRRRGRTPRGRRLRRAVQLPGSVHAASGDGAGAGGCRAHDFGCAARRIPVAASASSRPSSRTSSRCASPRARRDAR
jgi:hypothetical protein